ncbi:MAG: CotH kinase family protein, partial [Planctomycetota bacterium]
MPVSVKTSLLSLVLIAFLADSIVAKPQLAGDLNSDHVVNFKDLRIFAWEWLDPDCLPPTCKADIDGVNSVNMADLALLAKNWQIEEPHIVISEFMASNINTLADGDGYFSDWIELYNPSGTVVNLDGWYLTDDDDDLTKWQFPDGLEVKAGDFLLVFASEKTLELYPSNYPYLDPGGHYHTNFNLDKDPGEYLALVAPDGNTVIHEYAPEFPVQLADISYGLTQYSATLVPEGMTASYHVPTIDDAVLGTVWATADFDDSAWNTGKTGIGFGLGGERMVAYNDCVYRSSDQYIAENVTTYGIGSGFSGSTSGTLVDQVTGDDMDITVTLTESGGVNWQPDPGNGGSDCAVGTDAYNTFSDIADMTGVIYYGSAGWWVDMTFSGLDPTTDYTFATSAARNNYSGRLTIYTLTGADTYANASTIGVDVLAENKVRFNTGDNHNEGYVARWTGITAADGSFTVRAEADPISPEGRKAYSFDVFMLEGGSRGTDIQSDMLGVNASLWMRTEFNLEEGDPEIFDTLTLRMKYEDGFVAYLNEQEVALRNAPNSVQWDSTALSNRPEGDASVAEVINIMSSVNALQAGKNVLAIHGLNDNATDPNFLILPDLSAASNMSVPQYFTTPTPRTFNVPGAQGVVDEVWYSHERGFYDTGFQLILSTGDDNAEIRYTIDGSKPTITHGLTYSSPINVSGTIIVRAVAVKPGWLDSKVEAHTYIFLDDVILQSTNPPGFPSTWGTHTAEYGMDPDVVGQGGTDIFGGIYSNTIKNDLKSIPTMSVVMDVNDLFGPGGIYSNPRSGGVTWEKPGSVELIFPSGSEGYQANCGVRIYGGVGRYEQFEKHTLRLLFKSLYGPTKMRFPLFGEEATDEFDTIILRAGFNNSWHRHQSTEEANTQLIRDQWICRSQLAMGKLGLSGTFVHLYLNGLYWGLYNPVERCNADFGSSYLGGEKEEYDALNSYPRNVVDGTADAWIAPQNLADAGIANKADYDALAQYVDISNLIDYMILNIYAGNIDWDDHNWYSVRRRAVGEGWKFLGWDSERTLESITGTDRTGIHQYNKPSNFYAHLRSNAEFCMLFADHVHRHLYNDGALTPEKNRARYKVMSDFIDRAIVGESARWGDSSRSLPYTRDAEWVTERDRLLNQYFPLRTNVAIGFLRGTSPKLYPD